MYPALGARATMAAFTAADVAPPEAADDAVSLVEVGAAESLAAVAPGPSWSGVKTEAATTPPTLRKITPTTTHTVRRCAWCDMASHCSWRCTDRSARAAARCGFSTLSR